MPLGINNNILNQKGTPAFYSDVFANRPAFGFAGRVFISTDTGQIYEDTGSAWTLIADAGVGGGTLASVCANGNTTATGMTITAGNLGVGTATAGAPLDVHGTGTIAQFNGTGTNNAYVFFQNAGTSKWRLGNNYNAGVNSFDLYNNTLGSVALSVNNPYNVLQLNANLAIKQSTGIFTIAGYNAIACDSGGFFFNCSTANSAYFNLINLTGSRTYTFPDTNGTLALTSNLSSYLPLSGGTLTNNLTVTGIITGQTTSSGNITQNFLAYNSGTSVSGASYDFASGGTNQTARISANYEASLPDRMAMRFSVGQGSGLVEILKLYNSIMTVTGSARISGNVIIGSTTDDGNALQVTGFIGAKGSVAGLQFQNRTSSNLFTFYANTDIYIFNSNTSNIASIGATTGVYTPLSDINKKKDFEISNIGLNAILGLKPTLYRMKEEDNTEKHLGFIAQEVKDYIPHAYIESGDFIGLDYQAIVATLVKSIQELNEKLQRNNIN